MERLLITGAPGVGKTTLVRSVLERLEGWRTSGFYTAEERGAHGRTGFLVVTLEGRQGRLARVGAGEGPKVGRYTVLLRSFEATALPTLVVRRGVDLYVVDEVGKMECCSSRFVEAARRLLDSGAPLLATVAQHGDGLIAEAKARADVRVIEVTRENRDRLVDEVVSTLQRSPHPPSPSP